MNNEKTIDLSIIICEYNSKKVTAEETMRKIMKLYETEWLSVWKKYVSRKKSKKKLREYFEKIGFIK